MALWPPSLTFTACQVVLLAPALFGSNAGEPLSCKPPSNIPGSVGCCENETNSLKEPMPPFKLSNGLVTPQLPEVSVVLSRARYSPPSLPKYIRVGNVPREK